MDHPPLEEAPRVLEEPNLLWTPRIESEIETWRRTGVFPFPEMDLQSSQQFRGLSPIDLRLIHHLSSIYRDMRLADFVHCTLWVQQIPTFFDAAFGYDFVMSSILALSATHIAWMTNSLETKNLAYFHRGVALKGLQGAIGNFSRDNSDAVLAASILLSWQVSDWGGWTSLMHGISTVINSMSSWKHISRFSIYIEDHPAFFSPHSMQATSISFDDESLFLANNSLHRLSARLPNVHPLAQRLHEILNFAQDFQSCSTSMQSSQLFEKLQPLRARLFWMPVTLVKANDMGSSAMVLLAQLYTLALAIDSSIPELSGAALGSLTVHAIEQIDTKLRYNQAITVRAEMSISDLDELMHLPRLTLARHQVAAQSRSGQSRREEAFVQSNTPPHRQHSPYSFQHSSMGSQPGTPDYPPPGYPSTPPILPSHNFDDLSHPPSPFLHYGSPGSNPYSQSSPRPNSLTFDNRSLPGYEYSLRGDSPAYSPTSYSPGFITNSDEEAWAFGGQSPSFSGPVYGVIFLFKYPTGEKPSERAQDGNYDFDASEKLFFAAQTIQNACGTQALLSVVLNKEGEVDIGHKLKDFKDFTVAFPSELRGEALSNSELIRHVHNSFARSSPFVDEAQRSASEEDDAYHFIAYTPINGVLYELDGLQPAPISHGSCSFEEFPDKVIPVLQRRIERYPSNEIRFNLLAMVRDLRIRAQEIGDQDMLYQEVQKRNAWQWENALRRHNFIGLIGEVLKGVTASKIRQGDGIYDQWIEEAKTKTKARIEEKRQVGGHDELDEA